MTMANNKEYEEQVRPADRILEERRGQIGSTSSSRVVKQGTAYLKAKQSEFTDLEPMQKEDTLSAQAIRLHSIADRLLRETVVANDKLHRGGNKVSQGEGAGLESISSILQQTENLLERTEKELIILTQSLGDL